MNHFSELLFLKAIQSENFDAEKMFCEAGAELETTQELITDCESEPPLITAIRTNNSNIIQYLLSKKLNPNLISYDEDTVLSIALDKNNISLFKQLIVNYNVVFHDPNNLNLQALIWHCNLEVFDFVCDKVKDLDLNSYVDDDVPILTYVLREGGFNNTIF